MVQKTVRFRALAAIAFFGLICPLATQAQQPAGLSAQAQSPQSPQAPQSTQPQSTPVPQSQPRPAPQAVNIQLAILLTDKIDGKTAREEPISLLLADRQLGRLRRHLPASLPFANGNLEVDATPEIVGSRVRLLLTLNYQAPTASATGEPPQAQATKFVEIVEMATMYLDPGKPTTVIETSGDTANRRVTLQVTATLPK